MSSLLNSIDSKIQLFLIQKGADTILHRLFRAIYGVLHELGSGFIALQARSLAYTILISIVPLLAVSFSLLKAFGAHNQIKPFLLEMLAPLGEKGVEITGNIISFIDNVQVGVLGAVGVVILMFSVVSVISKIEITFNAIWHVKTSRSFIQRFSYYLSVIIFAPVLVFAGLGLTATLMNSEVTQGIVSIEPFGSMFYLLVLITPYIMLAAAFTLIYIFLPNTKVEIVPAILGALFAAILWQMAGYFFAEFVAKSSNYDAIYSGFAALIVFLLWLFIGGLIFLTGAKLAFYIQNPEAIILKRDARDSSLMAKEKMVLAVFYEVANNFYHDKPVWTVDKLAKHLRIPTNELDSLIELFIEQNILRLSDETKPGILFAKDLHNISLQQVIEASWLVAWDVTPMTQKQSPAVEKVTCDIAATLEARFKNVSVRDWVTVTDKS